MNDISRWIKAWKLQNPTLLIATASSHIYRVDHQGQTAVLKVLSEIGLCDEGPSASALKCYNGNGAVKLLEAEHNALLLEHIDGPKLSSLVHAGNDHNATQKLAEVVTHLHTYIDLPPIEIPTLRQRFRALIAQKGSKTHPLLIEAASLAEELLNSERDLKLLHGDLHHSNVLHSSDRGWLAIDPQPVYGECCYDVANIFYNPDNIAVVTENPQRIHRLAETFSKSLNCSARRLLEFAFAHGGLSIAWQLNEGQDPERRMRIAQQIQTLLLY